MQSALWATHEAVNRGAKTFGDWLLTLRGGLNHNLATAMVKDKKSERDPSQQEIKNRRILLALSWLSVEDEHGAQDHAEYIVARGEGCREQPDTQHSRDRKVLAALADILVARGVPDVEIGKPEALGTWLGDCKQSLSAAIRKGRGLQERLMHGGGVRILERGEYQLRWYMGKSPKYKPVGKVLADAVAARDNQISNLEAERAAKVAGRSLDEVADRKGLESERDKFIARKRMVRRRGGIPLDKETIDAYRNSINEFLKVSRAAYADQVTDVLLLEFFESLRKRGLAERTVQNNWQYLRTFLKFCGVNATGLLKTDTEDNRPSPLDKQPESYTREEMAKFLAACTTRRDRLAFECLLKLGLREKELTFSEFSDLHFEERYVFIHNKPELHFRTKTGPL